MTFKLLICSCLDTRRILGNTCHADSYNLVAALCDSGQVSILVKYCELLPPRWASAICFQTMLSFSTALFLNESGWSEAKIKLA